MHRRNLLDSDAIGRPQYDSKAHRRCPLDLVPHRPDHFPAAALEKRPAHRIVGPSDQAHLPELPRGRLRDHRVEKRPPDALPPMSFRNGDLVDPAACRPGPKVAIALDLAVPLGNGYEGPPGRGRIIKASCIRFPVEAVRVGKTLFSQPGKGRERPAERRYPVRSSCRVPARVGITPAPGPAARSRPTWAPAGRPGRWPPPGSPHWRYLCPQCQKRCRGRPRSG